VDRIEKRILTAAVGLMLAFFAGLAFAYKAYRVSIPTCVTNVKPFARGRLIQRGANDFEVQMVARMWSFEPAEVVLPPGARVALYLTSTDVVHGLHIRGTNVNLMAVPGTVNYAEVTFSKAGDYPMICHEYCGRNHQSMSGVFRIVPNAPLPASAPTAGTAVTPPADTLALFTKHDCVACHTLDGSSEEVAPTLKGVYGRIRELADGTRITADEAYLRDSILHPEKQVVKGYDAMPEVSDIPQADVEAMIQALRALGQPGANR
jgi:cytochrome c oxidase subunit 2